MADETRIRWNPEELGRLEKAALPILLQDSKLSLIEAVRRIQDTVLPPERRRNLVNVGSLPVELRNSLELKRKAASGQANLVPAEEVQKLSAEVLASQQREAELRKQLAGMEQLLKDQSAEMNTLRQAVKAIPSEVQIIKGFFSDILGTAMAKSRAGVEGPRMTSTVSIAQELLRQPLAQAPAPAKHDPEPKQEGGPKPPKVLVVGCKSQDRPRLESLLYGKVRLSFWTDESYSMLDDKAKNADMAFGFLSMVAHDSWAKVKRACPNAQQVPGQAVDRMRDEIENWLARRARGQA